MKIGDTVKIIQKIFDYGKIGKVIKKVSQNASCQEFFYFRIENCEFIYCDSQVEILENYQEELKYEVW